jgi:hypothetical protein
MTAGNAAEQAFVRNLQPAFFHYQYFCRTYTDAQAALRAGLIINRHFSRLTIDAMKNRHENLLLESTVYVVLYFLISNHFQKRFHFFLFVVPAPEIVCINLFF